MGKTAYLLQLSTLIFLSLCAAARAQQCPTDAANTDEVIAFLQNDRTDSGVPNECVVAAIHKLHYAHSKEAIDALVGHLDFRRSHHTEEVATGSNSDDYPAVSALFTIGRPALPALVQVIAQATSSKVARDNAVEAIMSIHRDVRPEGIRFLMSEAARSQDPKERESLRQGASSGLRWCQGVHRKECELALSSR